MVAYATRIYPPAPTHIGLTRIGVFSNLWPTAIDRADRANLGVWYLALHLYFVQVQFLGTVRKGDR